MTRTSSGRGRVSAALVIAALLAGFAAAAVPDVYLVNPGEPVVTMTPLTEAEAMPIISNLSTALHDGRLPVAQPGFHFLVQRVVASTELEAGYVDISGQGDGDLTPVITERGDYWDLAFDFEAIHGQLVGMALERSGGPEVEMIWLAQMAGAQFSPEAIAEIERMAREEAEQVQEHPRNPSASRVESELRSLSVALESYCVDYNAFPVSAAGGDPTNINAADPLLAQRPSFAWKPSATVLTTPVAYITGLFLDPYGACIPGTTYAYESIPEGDARNATFGDWIVLSPGPDGDWDLTLHETTPDAARARIYDATNGTVSDGDIGRAQQGLP